MYTYIQTHNSVPMMIYIPISDGNSEPYTGPMWVPVLLVGIVFTILIAFWIDLLKDILDWGADKVNVTLLVITTLVIVSLVLLLIL